MATHISEISTSGRCGTHQTLVQSKEAYATLIKKEQRRALVAPRITPSNQPSAEWLGPISRQHAEPERNSVPHHEEHCVAGSQTESPPSYVMHLLLREQQKQSRHEAELRQFKRLGALQLVDPKINNPAPKFLGEPLASQTPFYVSPIKVLPSQSSSKEHHLEAQKDLLFSDANETALLRAKARKERQLRHNQMIGNSVVDQSSTSPMFATALRDPVDPEAVLLCNESVEDRKRLEQRKHAKRTLLGLFNDQPKNSVASTSGLEPRKLPLLRSTNMHGGTRSPSPERDVALLPILQHQTKLLAKQVSLESVGAWDDAERERRKRNETLLDPKSVQNTADEEALVRRFIEDTGGAVPLIVKTRRQLILEQFEENRRAATTLERSKANHRNRRSQQPSNLFPNDETNTKKRKARN